MAIVQYLQLAGLATATVIVRNLSIPQPTVCNALRMLVEAKILCRTKVGTQIIYQLEKDTWAIIADAFRSLAK